MRARRHLSPEDQRALITRGGSLATLSQHPSWPDLEDEVRRKEERLQKHILAKCMSPVAPINQREVDYIRGFINGMNWLVMVPTNAESRLETYLKEHGVNLEGAST
jgi:hypothetical protein